ncbi:MAG: GNAT family N-acetyltransferase [Chloroflexi bacterium]|nr:GNAT family N-acetyltransferase [Chloroflexota bacterium]MYD49372.1 GNAT family N-acetyltransferase [Chloroflexota bacterium]
MEKALEIRVAEASDTATIAEFNAAMALESEGVALDMDVLTAGVQAALADSSRAFYLLGNVAGDPAGQLMVTYEWSDWRNGWIWWVQSVYVKPEFRRQGVYRRLYRRLEAMAAKQGDVRGIRLYVMRENIGAKRTYESLGMHHSEYDLYETDF